MALKGGCPSLFNAINEIFLLEEALLVIMIRSVLRIIQVVVGNRRMFS